MMLCALATPDDHPEDILSRVASLMELVGDYAAILNCAPPGQEPSRESLAGLTLVCQLVREAVGQAVANQKRRAAWPLERGLNEPAQNAMGR